MNRFYILSLLAAFGIVTTAYADVSEPLPDVQYQIRDGQASAAITPQVIRNGFLSAATGTYNPKNYGAVGDGNTHAIGTTYGTTLAALASYTSPSGAHPYAWATNAAYGLTFSISTSVDQGGAGTALTFQSSINGINGWSANVASFNGLPAKQSQVIQAGMTATASCLPAGTTVSSFNQSTGVVTLSQASTTNCASGTSVTFALSNTQVQALQADYLGIESAIYAASQSATGGTTFIPSGHYIVNQPIYNPGITNTNQFTPSLDIIGQGQYSTRLDFTADFGSGVCAIAESNRGPGSVGRNTYSKFWLSGPGTPNTVGTAVAGMDGLCPGSKDHIDHVTAYKFHAGVALIEDHGEITQSDFTQNFYGIYFAQNGDTIGNWSISNTYLVGEAWAGIAVAWNNAIAASHIQNLDIGGNSPYSFYREALPAGQGSLPMNFMSSNVIDNAWGESVGNGYIYGENAGDVVSQNTFIGGQPVVAMNNNAAFQVAGRSAKAVVYVGSFTQNRFENADFSNNGGNASQVTDAIFEVQSAFQGNDMGDQDAMLYNMGSKALINSTSNNGSNSFNTFRGARGIGEFRASEASINAGQIVTSGSVYSFLGARLNTASTKPFGVALQTVAAFKMVPVQTSGYAVVSKVAGTAVPNGSMMCPDATTPSSATLCSGASGQSVLGNDADGGSGAASANTTAYLQLSPSYAPPIATSSTAGIVKPDNSTITINNGVISSTGGGGGGGASILGSIAYDPGTDVTYTNSGFNTSTTADVDATNLQVSFVAPASGTVLVEQSAVVKSGGFNIFWSVGFAASAGASATSDATGSQGFATSTNSYMRVAHVFKLTGLTSGTTYYLNWRWASNNATQSTLPQIVAGAQASTPWGPATMVVFSD